MRHINGAGLRHDLRWLCFFLLIFCCQCGKQPEQPHMKYAVDQLQDDFRQLENYLRRHARYFTDDDELREVSARQYALITDSMSLCEYSRLIAPVLAAVRCGHARLSLPEAVDAWLEEYGNYLPLEIRVVHDTLVARRCYDNKAAIPPGSVITAIDGLSAFEIIQCIKERLPADGRNETYKYWQMNENFAGVYLACIADPEEYELSFVTPGDPFEHTVTLPAKSRKEIRRYRVAHHLIEDHKPLVSSSFAADSSYAALRIRFFHFYRGLDQFVGTIDSFFQNVRTQNITNLIVDLRGNDGGDPLSSAYLLGYLLGKPYRYFAGHSAPFYDELKGMRESPAQPFTGRLFVLVDGGCFSTTGHFCSLLKYHGVGTFIGEETGGSYACNGGYEDACLAHTGLCFTLSRTTFITAVQGLTAGRGIVPDYEIHPTIADIIEGRDPVWEKAEELIKTAGIAGITALPPFF
jgi:hypothetical protein